MSKIRIKSDVQLDSLLSSIAEEAVTASIHWRLCKDLRASVPAFLPEFNESRAFWSLTLNAHRDVVLFRLGRLYDQHEGGLSLKSLLETIQSNRHLFDEPNFRERMKDNAFVESLAQTARKPDEQILEVDIKSVTEGLDPDVDRLVFLRNKVLAHVDPRVALGRISDPRTDFGTELIEKLLERATTIVNRYNQLFKASIDSTTIVGHDDFFHVLRHIRAGREAYEREIDSQFADIRSTEARPEVF